MALDVLIRHEPSIKYTATVGRFGRSFYVSDGSHGTERLKGGLEAWQGYYQSARPTPGRIEQSSYARAVHPSAAPFAVSERRRRYRANRSAL